MIRKTFSVVITTMGDDCEVISHVKCSTMKGFTCDIINCDFVKCLKAGLM